MLKIKIIVVDRTRSDFLKQVETFYMKRLKRYAQTEWVEVKPEGIKKGRPVSKIVDTEGDSIAKNFVKRDHVIALDRSGKAYGSEELASHIEKLSLTHDRLTFVVGGPLGLSKGVLDQSHEIFSLSRLTLTHEMSRLVLLEQLYRAFTIINNEKYHK